MTIQINDSSVWRAFEDSELTHSAAHYLMTIMHLRQQNGYARVTDVAEHLRVSRGAASRAAALLKERNWIQEDPHRMLELTESGSELARGVQRNYLVIECFLEDILNVPAEIAREDACKMEHLLSPQTTGSLFRLIRLLMDDSQLRERINGKLQDFPADCASRGICEICEKNGTCIAQEARRHGVAHPGDFHPHQRSAAGAPEPNSPDPAATRRTLDELAPGQGGHVRRVLGTGDIHRRILEMGISRGVKIEVERRAPLHDPIKIKLRGYSLSLRRSEAQMIEMVEEPALCAEREKDVERRI